MAADINKFSLPGPALCFLTLMNSSIWCCCMKEMIITLCVCACVRVCVCVCVYKVARMRRVC